MCIPFIEQQHVKFAKKKKKKKKKCKANSVFWKNSLSVICMENVSQGLYKNPDVLVQKEGSFLKELPLFSDTVVQEGKVVSLCLK